MKNLALVFIIILFFYSCNEEPIVRIKCGTPATVRNLTGLDGCGYVFELANGSFLEPQRAFYFCGTPPLPQEVTEDPLYNFEFVEGKKVLIGYELTKSASICMAGAVVKITCLTEVASTVEK